MSGMQVPSSLFKAYDIRGVVPVSLTPDTARALGRAFGTHAQSQGEQEVAVGRDGRVSGPELQQALIQGLIEAGMQVIDVGMVTTPQLYFAASTACRSGIQVTGSHNPKDHNGFKMVLAGRAIYGEEIQGLRRIIEEDQWRARAGGNLRRLDVQDAYRQRITSDIRLARPMKIVVDSGNGVAGASAPGVFRALGCEAIELHVPGELDARAARLLRLAHQILDGGYDAGLVEHGRPQVVTSGQQAGGGGPRHPAPQRTQMRRRFPARSRPQSPPARPACPSTWPRRPPRSRPTPRPAATSRSRSAAPTRCCTSGAGRTTGASYGFARPPPAARAGTLPSMSPPPR